MAILAEFRLVIGDELLQPAKIGRVVQLPDAGDFQGFAHDLVRLN